jgi:hypothetical protein
MEIGGNSAVICSIHSSKSFPNETKVKDRPASHKSAQRLETSSDYRIGAAFSEIGRFSGAIYLEGNPVFPNEIECFSFSSSTAPLPISHNGPSILINDGSYMAEQTLEDWNMESFRYLGDINEANDVYCKELSSYLSAFRDWNQIEPEADILNPIMSGYK